MTKEDQRKKGFEFMDLHGTRASDDFTPEGEGGMTWRCRDADGDELVVGYVTHIPGMEKSPMVPGWRVDVLLDGDDMELELTTTNFDRVASLINGNGNRPAPDAPAEFEVLIDAIGKEDGTNAFRVVVLKHDGSDTTTIGPDNCEALWGMGGDRRFKNWVEYPATIAGYRQCKALAMDLKIALAELMAGQWPALGHSMAGAEISDRLYEPAPPMPGVEYGNCRIEAVYLWNAIECLADLLECPAHRCVAEETIQAIMGSLGARPGIIGGRPSLK